MGVCPKVRSKLHLLRFAGLILTAMDLFPAKKSRDAIGVQRGGRRLGGYESPPPANRVPEHDYNIVVGRLTDQSATIRVLLHIDARVSLSYGTVSGEHTNVLAVRSVTSGRPVDFVLEELSPNVRHFYQLHYESRDREKRSAEYTFHTQRDASSSFVFTVQADSHLDENTSGDVYLRTLDNVLADQPDFHFALGDTFMTG